MKKKPLQQVQLHAIRLHRRPHAPDRVDERALAGVAHVLCVLPPLADDRALEQVLPESPGRAALIASLVRRRAAVDALREAPVAVQAADGRLYAFVVVDASRSIFERLSALRKAAMRLLEESPRRLAVLLLHPPAERAGIADMVSYVLQVNADVTHKAGAPGGLKKPERLAAIDLFGAPQESGERGLLLARANRHARALIDLPPDVLTPRAYRAHLAGLAREHGWVCEQYDRERLEKLGAGAFLAVARGSLHDDAAIVHLGYGARKAGRRIALVGKGICFDTGGHNLKTARYMHGMHQDMAGSAVALALLEWAQTSGLDCRIDVWLALASNDISPTAYRQNEVVTALDGTRIEIVHTDAEGRMVLADTLALAARAEPDLIVDFATLTGSMVVALGNRMSGVFASEPALAHLAARAGEDSGERVAVMPWPEDYAEALESKVADIKQCTLEGEADHVLAACFLSRFRAKRPWVHVDLAAAQCKGGLGAVAADTTGFGVAWGAAFLSAWLGGEGGINTFGTT